MSRNNLRYQDLGMGPDTAIVGTNEPYLEFISQGEATSVNDLPTVVGISVDQDFLIVYIPGTGHRKILIEDVGEFFPTGGTTGQILIKDSNADYDVSWQAIPSGGIVDAGDQVTLNGDVAGFGLFDANGDVTVTASLTLPNVTLIDGGTAFSSFDPEITGPYGVLGLHPAGGVAGQTLGKITATDQDVGWVDRAEWIVCGYEAGAASLTTNLKTLEFTGPGVQLSSPSAGHIVVEIDNYPIVDGTEFCPGYPFTYVSTTAWRVENIDRSALFSVGKRLRFVDGAQEYFGVIASVIFTAGNTDITMTMENGQVLTNTIQDVCITRGINGWQLINKTPIGPYQMKAIAVGKIGTTVWWVIVGQKGEAAVSSDKGQNWTIVDIPTSDNLTAVCYTPVDEMFFACSDGDSQIFQTTDALNWGGGYNADLATAATINNGGQCYEIMWSEIDDRLYVLWNGDSSSGDEFHQFCWSADLGVTWQVAYSLTTRDATYADLQLSNDGNYEVTTYLDTLRDWGTQGIYTIPNDGKCTNILLLPSNRGWCAFDDLGQNMFTSVINGQTGWGLATDSVLFSGQRVYQAVQSILLDPLIVVTGPNGKIAVSTDDGDTFTEVSTGFSVTEDVIGLEYSEDDGQFIAISANEIAVSVSGTN